MEFDLKNPENQPIVEFMKNCSAVVADTASSSRGTLRKIMSTLGCKTANVDIAETFEEAKERIEKLKPLIVVCEFQLGSHLFTELYELQKKLSDQPLYNIFIVISDKNSPIITSAVAESGADALLVKPFNFQTAQDKVIELIVSKLSQGEFAEVLEEGRQLLEKEQVDEAIEKFQRATKLSEAPSMAYYYLGKAYQKKGEKDEAIKKFDEGLKLDPEHYRCLFGKFDLLKEAKEYSKAYDLGLAITKFYPVPMTRIPEFVKLSVRNGKYEDILGFYELFSNIDQPDEFLAANIAAGFVVYAKYCFRNKQEAQGLESLKRALNTARERTAILKEIAITYIHAGKIQEAESAMSRMPDDVRNADEIMIALVEGAAIANDIAKVTQMGADLINLGKGSKKLFLQIIEASVASGRPASAMHTLVAKAASKYPEAQPEFEAAIASLMEPINLDDDEDAEDDEEED